MQNYPAELLEEQVSRLLRRWGMPEDQVDITAHAMIDADLSAIDSHGISMLMNYDSLVAENRINMAAQMKIVSQTPAIAVLDADAGLGHPVAVQAVDLAIGKARNLGIGAVAVRNSHHFGATGYYVRRAAEQGLIGLATTTARVLSVIPTNGATPALSTNPLAFAAPVRNAAPFVLDMSTSTVAMNKVKAYALNEKDIPEGWVTDEAGRTVTDSADAYEYLRSRPEGGLVPLGGSTPTTGGHKGYGLSLMVQILSAALSSAALPGCGTDAGDNIGHFFLVINPEIFNPDQGSSDYAAELLQMMHDIRPVDPDHPVLVPGEPEAAAREHRRWAGIPLPRLLLEAIEEVCKRNDVEFLLQDAQDLA